MGKSALKTRKDREAQREQWLKKSLKENSSIHKNPIKLFIALRDGELNYKDFPYDSTYAAIGRQLDNKWLASDTKKAFFHLIIEIAQQKSKKLLQDLESLEVLLEVAKVYKKRIRNLKDWKCKSHNQAKQIGELLRFLFANYQVPSFMDQAFYTGHSDHIRWFLHMGKGGNIRTAQKLPLKISKKMAHYFMQAPSNYTITEALRYGQIRSLGGNERLVRYINATRLGQRFSCEAFWITVIHFFINNPMLDPVQIHPIVDYIQFMKYGPNLADAELVGNVAPEKPNFSMKGRTVGALLRDVEQWHTDLKKQQMRVGPWVPVPIEDFWHEEGAEHHRKVYQITQLKNTASLRSEGRAMKHCVASYAYSCRNGQCSIWSLTVKHEHQFEPTRLVTIELNRQKTIVQVRGKYNAMPTPKALEIISKWQRKAGLRMSKWVLND